MTDDDGRLIAGRYRTGLQIGSGAMGVVWQAKDERLHRTVALKQLLVQPGLTAAQAEEARLRAMREGRIAARLQHPNAITVYDVVEEDGQPWLVMEFLPSTSLATAIAERGALPPLEVARIGQQVASALTAAHAAGIVHRDVKPANVLLGDDGTVKITDFGISRAIGDVTVTATGMLAGTPAYLAPEMAKGDQPAPPSDVFSLGSTLYAAVEGAPPFGRGDNTLALLHAVAAGKLSPPRQAGPLTPLLARLLQVEPGQRPTMAQTRDALTDIAAGRALAPTALEPPANSGGIASVSPPVPSSAPNSAQSPSPSTVAAPAASAVPATPVTSVEQPRQGPVGAAPGERTKLDLFPGAPLEPAGQRFEPPAPQQALPVAMPPSPAPSPAAVAPAALAAQIQPFPHGMPAQRTVMPDLTRDRSRERTKRILITVLAVIAAAVIGVVVAQLVMKSVGQASGNPQAPPATPAASTSSAPAQPSTSVPPASTGTSTRPATTSTRPDGPATDRDAVRLVGTYFHLVPGNTKAGFRLLGPQYQAQGYASYVKFWSTIKSVSASNIRPVGKGEINVSLRFVRQDGHVSDEKYRYHVAYVHGKPVITGGKLLSAKPGR
ncbi:MAG: protein kinase [Sciscionella sp.]|nr:protein kinase [Sciscionella sp.]